MLVMDSWKILRLFSLSIKILQLFCVFFHPFLYCPFFLLFHFFPSRFSLSSVLNRENKWYADFRTRLPEWKITGKYMVIWRHRQHKRTRDWFYNLASSIWQISLLNFLTKLTLSQNSFTIYYLWNSVLIVSSSFLPVCTSHNCLYSHHIPHHLKILNFNTITHWLIDSFVHISCDEYIISFCL